MAGSALLQGTSCRRQLSPRGLAGEVGTWCWELATGGSRQQAPLFLSLAYFQQQQAGETANVSGPPCTTEHHVGETMGV